MSDSEKLTALKKAYADIILNTAKEAAVRVMASERKAMRYQQELFSAKDEALRLLVRLKQMFDSKVNEAEMSSLNQQKKIEELEAQLGEAEDIVRDLREELREAQDELEKISKDQLRQLDEPNLKCDVPTVEMSQENRISNFGSVMSSVPISRNDILTDSCMENGVLNGASNGDKCACKDNCYACNPDFASIVMRRKGPDLYRNGCTQRIHALKRNLLNGKFSLPGKVDIVKNNESIREDAEGKDICAQVATESDNMCWPEKKPGEFKVTTGDSNFIPVHAVNSFRRKRKRATRYKKSKASSSKNIPGQTAEMCQKADPLCSKTSPYAVDSNAQSVDNPRIIKPEAQNGPEFPAAPNSPDTTIVVTQLECKDAGKDDIEFRKACSFQDEKNKDEILTDKKELLRQEGGSTENLEVPSCKTEHETVDMSVVNSDVKASEFVERFCSKPINNKFLKYTFKRKRKKESMSSPDRDSSLDDDISRRFTEEKKNDSLESQKSTLVTESSRGSRRLAQVARQLISLSEKKWQK
ncbi:hypothetical protein SLA2020_239630 [Shorea laevis]